MKKRKKSNTHWTTTHHLSGSKILIWILEDWGHRYKSKQRMSILNVSLNILDFPQHYCQNVGRRNCAHKDFFFLSSSGRDCYCAARSSGVFLWSLGIVFYFLFSNGTGSRLQTSSFLPRTCETCYIGHSGSDLSMYYY